MVEIFEALDIGDAAGLTEIQAVKALESYAHLEGEPLEEFRAVVRAAPKDEDGLVAVAALARAVADASGIAGGTCGRLQAKPSCRCGARASSLLTRVRIVSGSAGAVSVRVGGS